MIHKPGDTVTISAWDRKTRIQSPLHNNRTPGILAVEKSGGAGWTSYFLTPTSPTPAVFTNNRPQDKEDWRLEVLSGQIGSPNLVLRLHVPTGLYHPYGQRIRYQIVHAPENYSRAVAGTQAVQYSAILDLDCLTGDEVESEFAGALDVTGGLHTATSNGRRTLICTRGETLADPPQVRSVVPELWTPYLWIDPRGTWWLSGLELAAPTGSDASFDRVIKTLRCSTDSGRTWRPVVHPEREHYYYFNFQEGLLQPGASAEDRFDQSVIHYPPNYLEPLTVMWSSGGALWLYSNPTYTFKGNGMFFSNDGGATWAASPARPGATQGATMQWRNIAWNVNDSRLYLIPAYDPAAPHLRSSVEVTRENARGANAPRTFHYIPQMGVGQLLVHRPSNRIHVLYTNTRGIFNLPAWGASGLPDGLKGWLTSDDFALTWQDRAA